MPPLAGGAAPHVGPPRHGRSAIASGGQPNREAVGTKNAVPTTVERYLSGSGPVRAERRTRARRHERV